jgi:hypothetical protein
MNFRKAYLTNIILVIFLIIISLSIKAQENQNDTIRFTALNKSKLAFFLDDTYFFGGITSSGIYYSKYFRELSYEPGLVFGVEQYFPLGGKAFLSTGLNFVQRNFSYLKKEPNIRVNNLYLDIPVATAFELPVLRNFDLRLILGANIGARLHSRVNGNYEMILENNPDVFLYNVNDLSSLDFGWTFGLSAEYRNLLFRFRSYSGFVKYDRKDQGMLSSFNIEIGHFLFRNLNGKKL